MGIFHVVHDRLYVFNNPQVRSPFLVKWSVFMHTSTATSASYISWVGNKGERKIIFKIAQNLAVALHMTILVLNHREPAEIISGRQQTVCTVASVKWSLRISIPTSSSRPLNHKASNTLIVSWDHPACCSGRIKTTHKDSVTEANTWSRGGSWFLSESKSVRESMI